MFSAEVTYTRPPTTAGEDRTNGEEEEGAVRADHKIEVVALPAMGTGFGGVSFDEAARQMAAAYRHYLEPPHRLDWDFVAERQLAVCYDGGRQVVR